MARGRPRARCRAAGRAREVETAHRLVGMQPALTVTTGIGDPCPQRRAVPRQAPRFGAIVDGQTRLRVPVPPDGTDPRVRDAQRGPLARRARQRGAPPRHRRGGSCRGRRRAPPGRRRPGRRPSIDATAARPRRRPSGTDLRAPRRRRRTVPGTRRPHAPLRPRALGGIRRDRRRARGPWRADSRSPHNCVRPDGVAVAFFGEGAMNQGMLLEALNLARVWNLPVVFVCKDSGLAITTRRGKGFAGDLVRRARGFGLDAERVSGRDVRGVWRAARRAVRRARRGGGPTFLLCRVHRPEGHFLGDPLLRAVHDPVGQTRELVPPMLRSLRAADGARTVRRLAGMSDVAVRRSWSRRANWPWRGASTRCRGPDARSRTRSRPASTTTSAPRSPTCAPPFSAHGNHACLSSRSPMRSTLRSSTP